MKPEIFLAETRKLLAQLQSHVDATRHQCICGFETGEWRQIVMHREQCQLLHVAIIGDIRRVANILGRTPTRKEYEQNRLPQLPGWTTVEPIFDSWNSAIMEAGLNVTRVRKQSCVYQ